MSKNKCLLLLAAGMMFCLLPVIWMLLAVSGVFVNQRETATPEPVYARQQSPSAHAGYRRTTLTAGDTVYIKDYEEYSLLLNTNPTPVVGRTEAVGEAGMAGEIRTIPGPPPSAYVVLGGRMNWAGIYRNRQLPPFDWRNAAFQAMECAIPTGPMAHKRTTDPTLIADVVRTLRDGTATHLPPPQSPTNIFGIHLFSEQLPGLIFCPNIYLDTGGAVFLAESFAIETTNTQPQVRARWIPASPQFTKWVQTP